MAELALVVGASGMVGRAVADALSARGWEVVETALRNIRPGQRFLDITDLPAAAALVEEIRPSVVIIASSYSGVDDCETHPEKCFAVNRHGPVGLASACRQVGARIIYYSSDYVFDGREGPYSESSKRRPINTYGRAKVAAEDGIAAEQPNHLIIRTTWVYDWRRGTRNYAMRLWETLSTGDTLRAPNDQIANPTLAEYLGEVTVRLIETGATGVVNVVGQDRVSRDQMARSLARAFGLDPALIESVSTQSLKQAALRPLNAGLTTQHLHDLLGTEPISIDDSMKRLRRRWRADTHTTVPRAASDTQATKIRSDILELAVRYFDAAHGRTKFVPFQTRIPYAGRVFDAAEIVNLVDASLDFWLTLGPWGERFEHQLKSRLGCSDVALVNSGSSANLVAVTALTSPQLPNPLHPGDEVITPAATFPTTVAPILQNGMVPVLVDCELGTYNIDVELVEAAISPLTRAMVVPHTLGNPVDLERLVELARAHGLYLVEDCCDALGSTFAGLPVGSFGDLATLSFYPAHHITMGEGGAVISNANRFSRIVRSIRDWGRDCWCAPGESNTCGRRFGWCFEGMPDGYDHKFTYSHIGYNLKPTDMQAAIGNAQLEKLDAFVSRRRANFARYFSALAPFQDRLILPRWDPRADPAWFAFPVTVRAGLERRRLVQWLEDANIETRELFAGNISRQPGFAKANMRIAGDLTVTDQVTSDAFFVGVYPGLTDEMIDFIIARLVDFLARN